MNRRTFLAALAAAAPAAALAQIPVPVPLAEDIAWSPLGGGITRAANGNYVVAVDASAYGRPGVTYVAKAAVVDANGTEWELDGPGGPGLPDYPFPNPYGGAVQQLRWTWEVPAPVQPLNQNIANNSCVLVRVRLYTRTFRPDGSFVDQAVAYDAGWQN